MHPGGDELRGSVENISFKCDRCRVKEPPKCLFCPDRGGVLRPLASNPGRWAHVACVKLNPLLAYVDNVECRAQTEGYADLGIEHQTSRSSVDLILTRSGPARDSSQHLCRQDSECPRCFRSRVENKDSGKLEKTEAKRRPCSCAGCPDKSYGHVVVCGGYSKKAAISLVAS